MSMRMFDPGSGLSATNNSITMTATRLNPKIAAQTTRALRLNVRTLRISD